MHLLLRVGSDPFHSWASVVTAGLLPSQTGQNSEELFLRASCWRETSLISLHQLDIAHLFQGIVAFINANVVIQNNRPS